MINAKCFSDDQRVEVNFDATPWFEQASEDQIKELATCEWGSNYAADDVALFMADINKKIQKMLDYCEHHPDQIGFECHVTSEDAIAWLRTERPLILDNLALMPI